MSRSEVAVPMFALQRSGLWSYARGLFSSLEQANTSFHMRYLFNQNRLPFAKVKNTTDSFAHAIQELEQERFQGICHFPVGNRRLFPLKRAINITTVHDLAEYHLHGRFGWKHDVWLKNVLVPMLQHMDRVIAISEQTRRDLLQFAKVPDEKIRVVHNGVDTQRFSPASPEEIQRVRQEYLLPKAYWIVVARLEHPVKNHALVLKAYAMLKARGIELPPLVFVGAQDIRANQIFEMIQSLGLSEDVLWLDFIPLNDLIALLTGARASIFPSQFEGFGLPILESLACGTPVLCSNIPVFTEFIPKGTPVFDIHDPDDLAHCLQKNLSQPRARVSLPDSFHWKDCARKTLQVYSEFV